MRLINCRIQNVRLHADLSIDFSPRITLISGANETGKSTLIEALHKTLFLKATATGASVEVLRSRLHLGHPTIQLQFEAKDKIYTLRKSFTGTSGQITLLNEANGEQLLGAQAEECLASILGVKESLSSRQAKKLLPSRWGHLWVTQGSSSKDLLKNPKSYYDFDSLLIQLEKKGGTVVQQSSHDQYVVKQIENAINENFSSRGIKKNSPFYQRKEELNTAETALRLARERQREYEQSSEELVEVTKEIENLQNKEVKQLLEQKRILSIQEDGYQKLKASINPTEKELEPIRLQHQTIEKALLSIDQLQGKIKIKEEEQKNLHSYVSKQKAKELVFINELEIKQENLKSLKQNLQSLDQKRSLLQAISEQLTTQERIARLASDLNIMNKALKDRKQINENIALLSKIERGDLENLQNLNQKIRDIHTRLEAMSTNVKVLQSNQNIFINGEEIRPKGSKSFNEVFEIKIGDDISLEITPGGRNALNGLQEAYQDTKKEFLRKLSAFKLKSLEVAEKEFEERSQLEQQLKVLGIYSQQDILNTQKSLDDFKSRAIDIESHLLALKERHQNTYRELSPIKDPHTLSKLQKECQEKFSHASSALKNAENEMQLGQTNLESFRISQTEANTNLKVIDSELLFSKEQLNTIYKEHGSQQTQKNQLKSIKKQLSKLEDHLLSLKHKVTSFTQLDIASQLNNVDVQLKSLDQRKETLLAQKGAAKRNCEAISSNNPYAAVEEAIVHLEAVKNDHDSLKRLTEAQKLLQELFLKAQSELSNRYTQPLGKSIGKYLKPLLSSDPIAKLSFDQSTGFNSIQLQRGKELYDFEELSGGMKEQLSAALRLSMAEVLKNDHNGCLPIIFDDAFTNSDPERIPLVKKMLFQAADKGLQIILLTCDPDTYQSFANKIIKLN
ncbi:MULTISPECIES: AAA family ATPase [unclassified Prochlorococcus]|uniref:AAA family ATPase n=1 Tax=unclassified Prochlorococcus TaxID=2627481 RepID=UPI000533B731|nr:MULTISPECIES: AAA family ATPase [unclassified Prochlorococcus]KGG16165.1 DNA double-strand break repair Rad50 ATPase [Prochlorococcus sp. MIT 0602]KGG17285.1 DNA double-strand break repair Rad50 ATPase [Prochlorococcus sp. MIT 0603]